MPQTKEIDLADGYDRWRWTYPNGHYDWEPTNHHFWCATCTHTTGVDGEFQELRDRKTDRQYEREECLRVYEEEAVNVPV